VQTVAVWVHYACREGLADNVELSINSSATGISVTHLLHMFVIELENAKVLFLQSNSIYLQYENLFSKLLKKVFLVLKISSSVHAMLAPLCCNKVVIQ